MKSHTHEFDESLRITDNNFQNVSRNDSSDLLKTIRYGKRELSYFSGTYTDHYITENINKLDLLTFRCYIPKGFKFSKNPDDKPPKFDSDDIKGDQWNRCFAMKWEDASIDVSNAPFQTPRNCVNSYFLNHNLQIVDKHKVEIIRFEREIDFDGKKLHVYYVPFISHADAGGFNNSVVDFYVRIPVKDRLCKFNKDLSNYLESKTTPYDIYENKGFSNLNIVGYEFDYPHFDKELQIMYYDRLDFYDKDTWDLIASL